MYYRERLYIFFPKIWSYTLDRIWKLIFLKKKYTEIWHFLQAFQKRPRWDMIFLVLSGKMVFFSRKHDIFSLGRKWEITFLKKYIEIWYFLCTHTGVINVAPRPSVKKNQRWSYLAKIHVKVIDDPLWLIFQIKTLERAPQHFSVHSWRPLQAFSYCSATKNNRKRNIQNWSLTFSSIYLVGDIPQWIIFNTLYHSFQRSSIWRCAWAPTKAIICPLGDGFYFQKYKNGGKKFLVQS